MRAGSAVATCPRPATAAPTRSLRPAARPDSCRSSNRPGTGRVRRPDLVAVLARILRRIKGPDGHVPLLSRYDGYERLFGPPLPHLFQRPYQHRLDIISPARVPTPADRSGHPGGHRGCRWNPVEAPRD